MTRLQLRSRSSPALLCALLVLSTGPLSAEPKPSGEQAAPDSSTARDEAGRARAQELYEQAAKAYASRKNFEAIELFRQSAALEPSPLLFYNMALAYEEAGDVRNALKYFRVYLVHAPRADDAPDVRHRIARLEGKLEALGIQQLTVTSAPEGATLYIDGVAAGVTPFTGEFAPGSYALSVALDGYEKAHLNVLLPKERALEVPLKLEPARPQPTPAAPKPAPSEPAAPERPPARIQPLTWSLLGVGAGSLTAGVLFEVSRQNSKQAERDAASAVEAAEARGAADAKQLASLLLLGAGGAFLITGGVLALLDLTEEAPTRAGPAHGQTSGASGLRNASAACLPGFCGAVLSGQF